MKLARTLNDEDLLAASEALRQTWREALAESGIVAEDIGPQIMPGTKIGRGRLVRRFAGPFDDAGHIRPVAVKDGYLVDLGADLRKFVRELAEAGVRNLCVVDDLPRVLVSTLGPETVIWMAYLAVDEDVARPKAGS